MNARESPDPETAAEGVCPSCGTVINAGDRFCGGCGAPVPLAAEAELLAELQDITLGQYEIRGVLGRGGMGLVYLAQDISLNKKVAIKVLPPSAVQGEVSVERFRREARIAASLRHRHISSVFALRETTRLMFFVMEYVEGRTVDAILHDEERLPADLASVILADTASALSYAHHRDIIHRDLKPGNIMVDGEGMAMVMDFGLAKASRAEGLTTTGSVLGTPRYMSPEQWSGKATSRSDQYALGCVAYELLAGRAPFVGETVEELMRQHIYDAPRPLRELRACPPALASSVMRMLEKDPARRWPSVEEAVAAMRLTPVAPQGSARARLATLARRGQSIRALPPTPKSPLPPAGKPGHSRTRNPDRRRRLGLRLVAIGALAAGVGFAGYLAWSGTGDSIDAVIIAGAPPSASVGDRVPLAVRGRTAAGEELPIEVVWSMSDSSVGDVSAEGVFTAAAPGVTTLTASHRDKSGSVKIAVHTRAAPVAVVEITPRSVKLFPGESLPLVAITRDAAAAELHGRPVLWTSNAPGIASVSGQGLVTGVAPGIAVVVAVSEGQSGGDTITVLHPGPVSLRARPAFLSLLPGRTVRLHADAWDAKGNLLAEVLPRWSTGDPVIATVSAGGDVTALRPGTVRISVSIDGVAGTPAVVTVAGPSSKGIGLLQVMVTPWANLKIDGVDRGARTRSADSVSAGVPHRLRFDRPGFESVDTSVTLRPGERRLIQIQLKPRGP